MRIKNFKMAEFFACNAETRPPYCKFKTNVCCFNCEHNAECMNKAKYLEIIRPCDWTVFDQEEVCPYAV